MDAYDSSVIISVVDVSRDVEINNILIPMSTSILIPLCEIKETTTTTTTTTTMTKGVVHAVAQSPFQECARVYATVCSHPLATPFQHPVNVDTCGCLDYYEKIVAPMDLSTLWSSFLEDVTTPRELPPLPQVTHEHMIEEQMMDEAEKTAAFVAAFQDKMALIWRNALEYNGENSEIGRAAIALRDVAAAAWAQFDPDRGMYINR
jgi:hypothetical protein